MLESMRQFVLEQCCGQQIPISLVMMKGGVRFRHGVGKDSRPNSLFDDLPAMAFTPAI